LKAVVLITIDLPVSTQQKRKESGTGNVDHVREWINFSNWTSWVGGELERKQPIIKVFGKVSVTR